MNMMPGLKIHSYPQTTTIKQLQDFFSILDSRIRKRFRLFNGSRQAAVDKKLYLKIYGEISREFLVFLKEHLRDKDISNLMDDLHEINASEADNSRAACKSLILLLGYLDVIDDGLYKLDCRFDHFINNLLIDSLTGLNRQSAS